MKGMRRPGLGLGFELGVRINGQTGADKGGSLSFNTSFSDISSGLFGTDSSTTGTGKSTEKTDITQTESLKINEAGLLQLIDKALKGVGGLAEIFGQQAGAGLFGGSVAKEGTEDLLAKIAGELALVTGVKTAKSVGGKTVDTKTTQEQESEGLVDQVGSFLGL